MNKDEQFLDKEMLEEIASELDEELIEEEYIENDNDETNDPYMEAMYKDYYGSPDDYRDNEDEEDFDSDESYDVDNRDFYDVEEDNNIDMSENEKEWDEASYSNEPINEEEDGFLDFNGSEETTENKSYKEEEEVKEVRKEKPKRRPTPPSKRGNQKRSNKTQSKKSSPSKQQKQVRKPKTKKELGFDPDKKPETLSEWEAYEEYKKSDEYKEKMKYLDRVEDNLKDKGFIRDVLESATVDTGDLGKITIVDEARTISNKENFDYIRTSDPTYQIVLNQSAYIADVKSLKFKDIFALSNSVSNTYSSAQTKYQTYFRSIAHNSLGVSDFETWSKITSLYDVPTIEFGIFNQTFPGDTEFDIKCSHCGQTMRNIAISNDYLISTKDDSAYERLNDVINDMNDLKKIKEYSLVNKIDRFQLPSSKAIIDIRIPAIKDYLDLLSQVPDDKIQLIDNYIDVLLFIKDVFIIDIVATKEDGKPVFVPLTSKNDILEFLKGMSLDDVQKLNKEIGNKDEKYRIDYQIKSFPCTNCKNPTGNINIDIETLLFEQAVVKLITD